MNGFGLLFIIVGLGIALIAVMNNHETDYDAVLRQSRETVTKSANELRAVRDATNAITSATGRKFDSRIADSGLESSQQSIAGNTAELEERARARSSKFTTTLVVAGVLAVLGLVLRSRNVTSKSP